MESLIALLQTLRADDYVRFKYGKQLDAALAALQARPAIDTRELEQRLEALLAWTRTQTGGGPPQARPKRRPAARKGGERAPD